MTDKTNQTLKIIIAVAVFAVLIIGTYFAYNALTGTRDAGNLATGEGGDPPNISDPALDLVLLDYKGNELKLSDLKGKPIVLNFWASWCPPCKSEMPHFEKAFKEYGEEVHFVMVNCVGSMESETQSAAKKYIEAEGYSFPVYFDMSNQSYTKYGAASIPMTFFINSDGEIKLYAKGTVTENQLKNAIKDIK